MSVFLNLLGDQTYRGTPGTYDQVDFDGGLRDYELTLNPDGSVTVFHPEYGTDTLVDINGLWFAGEARWYSIEQALEIAGDVDGTVDADGTIVGNLQDNDLIGTSGDDVFYGDRGDDFIDGNGGGYNQVDYDGALSDYHVTRNPNGTVSVANDTYGTDVLADIDGLWFGGEQRWYSIDDAIEISSGADTDDGDNASVDVYGVKNGTNADDTLTYGPDVNALYGGLGNDTLVGVAGDYSQANYDGKSRDYGFTRNDDGTVTVTSTVWGTDTLVDIDGIWFAGERAWYALDDLLGEGPVIEEPVDFDPVDPDPVDPDPVEPDPVDPDPVDPDPVEPDPVEPDPEETGTLIDGVITGSNTVDDLLLGSNGDDVFAPGMGVDRIEGGDGRDVVNVDGDVIEWTFGTNAQGETVMTHPTWGENTLDGVELVFFGRSGLVLSVADAVAQTDGLPAFRLDADDVLNGTNGDDRLVGNDDGTNFYGGVGNDSYFGTQDSFDQVNYDGARSEFSIALNRDGSVTVDHPVWGFDTLSDIDALVFTGREPGAAGAEVAPFEFVNLGDLFVENRVLVSEAPQDFSDFG